MDFSYSTEQEQLRRRYVSSPRPRSAARHGVGRSADFPGGGVRKCGQLGYLGSSFPRSMAAPGFGYVEYAIIIEELARVDPSVALIVAAHTSLCTNHILPGGHRGAEAALSAQAGVGRVARLLVADRTGGGLRCGRDAHGGGSRTTEWVVNGAKTFTTNAHYAQVCVAMAVTDRARRSTASRRSSSSRHARFRAGKKENKLGMRASATGEVIFTDCRVPASQLLGKPGEGFVDSLRSWTAAAFRLPRCRWASRREPTTRRSRYSKQRKQFGRLISEFQAIQHKLVDMATEIEAARLLSYARRLAEGPGAAREQESAMAKLYASEMAVRVANEAVQIHGGYGFIKDYPVEKFYRDVKLCTIGEGTSEIQRLVIARQLLKNP